MKTNAIYSQREFFNEKKLITTLKVFSVIFAFVYLWRVLSRDYFDISAYTMMEISSSHFKRIIIALIRMLTNGVALITMTAAFFDMPYLRKAVRYFAPVMAIINLFNYSSIIYIYLGPGVTDGLHTYFRIPQFFIENFLTLFIVILHWVYYLVFKHQKQEESVFSQYQSKIDKQSKWKSIIKYCLFPFYWIYHFIIRNYKLIGRMCLLLLFVSIINAPLSTLLAFFGPANRTAIDLNTPHRIFLYLTLLVPFILFFVFREKTYQTRYFLCLSFALAAFFCYFSYSEFSMFKDITTMPFHLCNMAVVIMLIAFVFHNRPCFYFNYLINILGGIFAALMPDTVGDIFYFSNMRFWHNHASIIFLPMLAVGLRVFSRPTWKMLFYSLIIFSIYFVFVGFIDAYFGEKVNYFFLNSDKIASHASFLVPIRERPENQIIIHAFGRDMVIYIWYWLLIYIGYCGLAVGTWFVYTLFYRISDSHLDLRMRLKRIKMLEKESKQLPTEQFIELGDEAKMIKISHLTKVYGKDKKKAVDDFSLEIKPGDIFGFLGHNGAGKSTLIKCLIGAQTITEGKISIFGHDITEEPIQTKMLVGYVPDNHAVYEGLTGREYVNYIADLYLVPTKERTERLNRYSNLFEITKALDKPIKSYSHGMKQKITIIAALIHDPKVWVLDEPLTGLDPKSIYQIKQCMKEQAERGNIVFFSSHVIDVVESVCTKICVISHGQLKCVYDLKDLKKDNIKLEDIYLEYVQNADRDEE